MPSSSWWDRANDRYAADRAWDEEPSPSVLSSQQHDETMPAVTRKRPTKAEAQAARAAQRRSETSRAGAQVKRRQRWEASDEGRHRLRDVVDIATEEHNRIARERPELGLQQRSRLNMSPAQVYDAWGFHQPDKGPGIGERQLPGMEDPHSLPESKRWEEYSPDEQKEIARRVKLVSGSTIDSMRRSFGAQLDQAYVRARSHGHEVPYATGFYTSESPPKGAPPESKTPFGALRDTARETNTPLGLVAAVNADTSPQMRFEFRDRQGKIHYPNAEQAAHAIRHVQAGGDPERIDKSGLKGMARAGFDKNLVKAARRADQVINMGRRVRDTVVTKTHSGFGPKTSPYHNSWLPSTPDFLVVDRHTGHGLTPHLDPRTPVAKDARGNVRTRAEYDYAKDRWVDVPRRNKSEVEKAIEEPGFHAMADYAARQALAERGFTKIRQAQASQWGEEKLQRGEAGTSRQQPKAESVYPTTALSHQQFDPNQQRLWEE